MNADLMITKPERWVLTLPGGLTMSFRLIPAGSFRMGSRGADSTEEPIHWVKVPEPFWMAETPVTQAQFAVWTQREGIPHQNVFDDPPLPENPAENLDRRQANACCDWLSRVVPDEPGNVLPDGYNLFCLPTEAEWE